MFDFQAWPKTPRLENEKMIITEKIDGTNAQISFNLVDYDEKVALQEDSTFKYVDIIPAGEQYLVVQAGSRNRWITPDDDNFAFAKWVKEHATKLYISFGVGRIYGEWWGNGIQRGYDRSQKHFAYFNTLRPIPSALENMGVAPVPVLYSGEFNLEAVSNAVNLLKLQGSMAAPGYMKPEGVCVYLRSTNTIYKVPFDK